MLLTATVLTCVAAAVHVYIFVLESLTWTSTRTRATFGTSPEEARVTKPLAFNQGFYNLFLAIIATIGVLTRDPRMGFLPPRSDASGRSEAEDGPPNGTGVRVDIVNAEDAQLPRVGGHHVLVRCEGRVFRAICGSAKQWRVSERIGTTDTGHGDLLAAAREYQVVTAAQSGPPHPTWQRALQHHIHSHSDLLRRRPRNPRRPHTPALVNNPTSA